MSKFRLHFCCIALIVIPLIAMGQTPGEGIALQMIESFSGRAALSGDVCARRSEQVSPVTNWWRRGKMLCPLLSQYSKRPNLTFDRRDPPHPCASLTGAPTVYDSVSTSEKLQMQRYGGPDYRSLSRNQLVAQGYRVATTLERAQVLVGASTAAAHVGAACCGTDRRCWSAFRKIPMKFCVSPQNANQPDSCADSRGYYQPSSQPFKRGELHLGTVVISPYIDPDVQYSGLFTHEFSHACSNIQAQLRNMPAGEGYASPKCQVTAQNRAHYQQITSRLSADSGLVSCLATAASVNARTSMGYIPWICPSARLEEAYAMASSALLRSDVNFALKAIYPQMCEALPSAVHPYNGDVLKCLLSHSPKIRRALGLELLCNPF